jgi:hypothetical protein
MSGITGRSSIVLTSFLTDEFLDAEVEHAKQHLRNGPPWTSGSVSIVIGTFVLWVWGSTPLKSVICALLRWNLSCVASPHMLYHFQRVGETIMS